MRNTNEFALAYEINEEKARRLGEGARQMEQALKAIHDYDARIGAEKRAQRDDLVADAAERAYFFMVQRELCGLRDWSEVVEFYTIPDEVLSRLGCWKGGSNASKVPKLS